MLVDIHNHTPLCKHAQGSPMEYAARAYELGCRFYGFSDHAPMDFDKRYRMSFEQMSQYEDQIRSLQKDYEGKMDILLGYEVDYLPGKMDERVLKAEVDFLIGSVHFLGGWGFDNPEFIGEYKNKDIDLIWQEYFKAIEDMASSGKFDIVGHLDLIKIFKFMPKKDIKILAAPALKAIKKANMVIEINSAGFRKPVSEPYPSKELLAMARELGINITFSSDAHALNQIGANMSECMTMAKELGYDRCVVFKGRDKIKIEF